MKVLLLILFMVDGGMKIMYWPTTLPEMAAEYPLARDITEDVCKDMAALLSKNVEVVDAKCWWIRPAPVEKWAGGGQK